MSIELDEVLLTPMLLIGDIPVDPGPHTIVVRIGDKELSRTTVSLAEKETKVFEVKR